MWSRMSVAARAHPKDQVADLQVVAPLPELRDPAADLASDRERDLRGLDRVVSLHADDRL